MKLKKVYFHNCYYEKIGNNEPVKLEDLPFDIPDNWAWVRINNYVQKVTDFVASGSFASLRENVKYYKEENYALMVKTQDFQNNFSKDLTFTDKHGYNFLENSNLDGGELVLANVGSIGKVFIVPKLNRPMTLAPNSIMVRFFYEAHLQWFLKLFQSSFGLELLLSISSATAIKKFNKTDFKTLLIPLPPLEEQQRIVDKINSFEPLLERYDKVEKELSKLEKEFPEKLKKSILQYAIEGKLVKQNPNDEPASALLERIKQDKERLIKEGKIKKEKNDNLIIQADYKNYYEKLPKSWSITTLSNISLLITKGTTPRGGNVAYLNKGIGFLRAENVIGYDKISQTDLKYIDEETHLKFLKRSILIEDDILITIAGTLGRTGLIKKHDLPLNINQAISIIRIANKKLINLRYLIYVLNAPLIQNDLTKQRKITAIPNLTLEIIADCIIPIAPVNQQNKIVKKLDYLFSLI